MFDAHLVNSRCLILPTSSSVQSRASHTGQNVRPSSETKALACGFGAGQASINVCHGEEKLCSDCGLKERSSGASAEVNPHSQSSPCEAS